MRSNTVPDGERQRGKPEYAATDAHLLATAYIKAEGSDSCGHLALRYWRDEFWRFNEGRYWRVSQAETKARVAEFISRKYQRERPATKKGQILSVTTSLVNNTMQALTGRCLVEAHVEQPTWLGARGGGDFFVFANGRVELATLPGRKEPCLSGPHGHCAEWFTQTTFPYDYDPNATCPLWTRFLDEVLGGDGERISLLQQWFGYCLTPDTTQQKFMTLIGEGQNGKSVVLDVLTSLLGEANVSHVPVEVFDQRFQLTMTLGRLANISYDTGAIKESAEATIKEFTAGDRMYFDRKGVAGITAYPTARLILATNQDPRFTDRSKGIWRRMIPLPFLVDIPADRQDPQLVSKLKAERSGIFNWAFEGLVRLRTTGRFIIPQVCAETLERYRAESNPAGQFLAEHYEGATAVDAVGCNDVYQSYRVWCTERGLKALDVTNFGKELRKLFPQAERVRDAKPDREGKRPYRYVRLRQLGTEPHLAEGSGAAAEASL